MNVLFLMLNCSDLSLDSSDLYSDLAKEFYVNGHNVTVIAPSLGSSPTKLSNEGGIDVLRVKSLESNNIASILKKGLALSILPFLFKKAYQRYFDDKQIDLLLMPTPPITLVDFANYVKKKTGCKFYLILRDIHPQSCKSIEVCTNPLIYRFLHVKAQRAYRISDFIGCMSNYNIDFVKSIAKNIDSNKIVLLPNWQKYNTYKPIDKDIRKQYGLEGKFLAVFGGTIGVGQDFNSIVNLAEHYKDNKEIVFLIVGKGIRKQLLIDQINAKSLSNVMVLDYLPRNDYDNLLKSTDLGLISIDHRYTVPTCPSKIIGYMSMKLPVIAMINKGSDYGQTYIKESGCGLWSENNDTTTMLSNFDFFYNNRSACITFGESGYQYYLQHFTSKNAFDNILKVL